MSDRWPEGRSTEQGVCSLMRWVDTAAWSRKGEMHKGTLWFFQRFQSGYNLRLHQRHYQQRHNHRDRHHCQQRHGHQQRGGQKMDSRWVCNDHKWMQYQSWRQTIADAPIMCFVQSCSSNHPGSHRMTEHDQGFYQQLCLNSLPSARSVADERFDTGCLGPLRCRRS